MNTPSKWSVRSKTVFFRKIYLLAFRKFIFLGNRLQLLLWSLPKNRRLLYKIRCGFRLNLRKYLSQKNNQNPFYRKHVRSRAMANMFVFGGHSSEKVIKKVFVEQTGWNSLNCVCLLNYDSFLIFSPMFFPLFNAMREAKEQRCCGNCFSPIRLVSLSVYLSFSFSLSHPYNKQRETSCFSIFLCVRVYVFFWMFVIVRGKLNKTWMISQKKNHFTHFSLMHKKERLNRHPTKKRD